MLVTLVHCQVWSCNYIFRLQRHGWVRCLISNSPHSHHSREQAIVKRKHFPEATLKFSSSSRFPHIQCLKQWGKKNAGGQQIYFLHRLQLVVFPIQAGRITLHGLTSTSWRQYKPLPLRIKISVLVCFLPSFFPLSAPRFSSSGLLQWYLDSSWQQGVRQTTVVVYATRRLLNALKGISPGLRRSVLDYCWDRAIWIQDFFEHIW